MRLCRRAFDVFDVMISPARLFGLCLCFFSPVFSSVLFLFAIRSFVVSSSPRSNTQNIQYNFIIIIMFFFSICRSNFQIHKYLVSRLLLCGGCFCCCCWIWIYICFKCSLQILPRFFFSLSKYGICASARKMRLNEIGQIDVRQSICRNVPNMMNLRILFCARWFVCLFSHCHSVSNLTRTCTPTQNIIFARRTQANSVL